MSAPARIHRLRQALTWGHGFAIDRLLAEDPDLPQRHPSFALSLYDLDTVRARLAADPGYATSDADGRPLFASLCFSQYFRVRPDLAEDMMQIARLMLGAGADPNTSIPTEDSDHRLSVLYGALGHAGNMALAELLLERGASPDDNESLYHATEMGHLDGLRLLLRHNANPAGTNALNRALDFNSLDMVRILIEGGADPNERTPDHPSGQPIDIIPALHQAARRWCGVDIATYLLDNGADPALRWHGATAYALARRYGNAPIARLLKARGHAHPLDATEAVLADCAQGHPPPARLDFAGLETETRRIATHIAARPDRLDHLKALILAGADPEETEAMGLSPLHVAVWEGLVPQTDYLLSLAPDLNRLNAYGGNALSTALHGAEFCPARADRDHLGCIERLIAAGATVPRSEVDGQGREDVIALVEDHPDTIT